MKYKMIGAINFFNINPSFITPVFTKEGKFFFQKIDDDIVVDFVQINISELLTNYEYQRFDGRIQTLQVGMKARYAYAIDENNVLVDNRSKIANEFVELFEEYFTKEMQNELLLEEILEFLKEDKSLNNVEKRFKRSLIKYRNLEIESVEKKTRKYREQALIEKANCIEMINEYYESCSDFYDELKQEEFMIRFLEKKSWLLTEDEFGVIEGVFITKKHKLNFDTSIMKNDYERNLLMNYCSGLKKINMLLTDILSDNPLRQRVK